MASKFVDEIMIACEEYKTLLDKVKDRLDFEQYMEHRMDYSKQKRKSKKCEQPSVKSTLNNIW